MKAFLIALVVGVIAAVVAVSSGADPGNFAYGKVAPYILAAGLLAALASRGSLSNYFFAASIGEGLIASSSSALRRSVFVSSPLVFGGRPLFGPKRNSKDRKWRFEFERAVGDRHSIPESFRARCRVSSRLASAYAVGPITIDRS